MAGKYRKAPLVYMSAAIKTTPFTELSEDEWRDLSRMMLRMDFPIPEESWIDEVDLSPLPEVTKVKRRAYFSIDRKTSIVFDKNALELRTTSYNKYLDFTRIMEKFLREVSSLSDIGLLHVQEVTLSYVDIIVPFNGRKLEDYFAKGDRALPLGVLDDVGPAHQSIGNLQLTRVVDGTKKIFFAIEQVPTISKQVRKFLPLGLSELSHNFSMPIDIMPEWENVSSDYYCLLTTQASMLLPKQLKDVVFSLETKDLHSLVSKTFNDIINKENCNVDWEYTSH